MDSGWDSPKSIDKMIKVDIPGWKLLEISHIVCDMNGTLAVDGYLEEGVIDRLEKLSEKAEVYILTADTYNTASSITAGSSIKINKLTPDLAADAGGEAEYKAAFVEQLGSNKTAFLGNGANDLQAIETAVLSIAVAGKEGAFSKVLIEADLVAQTSVDALDLLLRPARLIAGLRR